MPSSPHSATHPHSQGPTPAGPTPAGPSSVGSISSPPPTNQNPSRRRDWSSLPGLAVFNIATRLDTIQFKALAAVCRPWRSICTQNKAQIIAHHPPLLLGLDLDPFSSTQPICHLYNFPDHRFYTKPLPPRFHIPGADRHETLKLGCFHGYIIHYHRVAARGEASWHNVPGQSLHGIMYLVNPFTEEIIALPPVARHRPVMNAVLTAPPASADSVVVAFTWDRMMVCRPGVDDSWSDVHLTALLPPQNIFTTNNIRQAVFFKGRVYIVKNNNVIAVEVKFGQDEEVSGNQFPPFYVGGQVSRNQFDPFYFRDLGRMGGRCPLLLFVGENELFVVDLELKFFPNVGKIKRKYRLRDGEGGSWEEVENLGGLALFTTHSSEFVPSGGRVTGWEQRGLEDQVFFVDSCLYHGKDEDDLPPHAPRLEFSPFPSLKSFDWASANNEGALPAYARHLECGFNCVPSLRSYYNRDSANNKDDLPPIARRLESGFNRLPSPTNLYWVSPRGLI